MVFLIWVVVAMVVYVATFKNDFTKDHIDKAAPFLVLVCLFVTLLGVIGSL